GSDAMDDTAEVYRHDPIPKGKRYFPGRVAVSAHTRVVAKDVHSLEPFDRLSREFIDRLGQRNVRDDTHYIDARVGEPGNGLVEGRLLDVGHDNIHALLTEALSESEANTAGCASDNDCPAVQ